MGGGVCELVRPGDIASIDPVNVETGYSGVERPPVFNEEAPA